MNFLKEYFNYSNPDTMIRILKDAGDKKKKKKKIWWNLSTKN